MIETASAANDDTIMMIVVILLVNSASFSVSTVEVGVFQLSVSSSDSSASQLLRSLAGGSYTGDYEIWMTEDSGNGASLSLGAL